MSAGQPPKMNGGICMSALLSCIATICGILIPDVGPLKH